MDALPLEEQKVWWKQRRNEEKSVLQVFGEFHSGNLRWRNPALNQQGKSLKY